MDTGPRSPVAPFATWCRTVRLPALPATGATVAGYVSELAFPPDDRSPAAVATITRRLAAAGVGLPLLMTKSRHTSLTSLAIYAKPTFDPVAAATAALDPARRHR